MTMINEPTTNRNAAIETVDRLIDECPHTCADITLRFTTTDGREIRVNARQFYGMLRSPYAKMPWLADVTMVRLTERRSSKVISTSAPDGVSVCACGNEAEYTGGVCRDCHESAIDIAVTQYEASYRQGAL